MSNENSTTNIPLTAKGKRYRNFCLSSYCNTAEIQKVLLKHDKQIRAYAYIVHDKDVNELGLPKEEHVHILLSLINNTTVDAVRNWFKGFIDEKDMPKTTLAQPMHDITSSFDYLTHNTEQAKEDGKYQYDESEIISNNKEFFQDSALQEQDNVSLALCELLDGVPLSEVAKKYGRDFIIHYQSIKLLMQDIYNQTGGN